MKDILPLQQWLVKTKMCQSILTNEDDARTVVAKIDKFEVTKECFRQLGVNNSLQVNVMDAVASLFQFRDNRISESHHSVNSNRNGYRSWKRSIYLGPSFWDTMLQGMKNVEQLKEEYFFGAEKTIDDYIYVYIYLNNFDAISADPWSMIRINLLTHNIEYLDGRINGRVQPLVPEIDIFLNAVKAVLQPLLLHLIPSFTNEWQCGVYRETYFELLDNQYDSGVYVAAITYFLSVGVPLYFDRASISRLRMNLAYWILVGELPK